MNKPNLKEELLSAGAGPVEADELMQLAMSVSQLKGAEPQYTKSHRKRLWPAAFGFWPMLGTAAAGLAAGTLVVAIAQTSLPGSWLYPVKRTSERVAMLTQPDYKAVVMMHRAQEVRMLVATKQSDHLVTAALSDYKTDMQGLKTKNYAALDYCHDNLVQAGSMATPVEKQQISSVLTELNQDKD
ncbi:MAG TPA: hypothetical protein VGH44_03160 [Candidatus Saccharimonadia bacterium]|jgi:hypothetical protein